jgi:hypothetical protein
MNKVFSLCLLLTAIGLFSPPSHADGAVVDKVYHPYVVANEQEFEWRVVSRQFDDGNELSQRFAYGRSVSEFVKVEAYIVGNRDGGDDYSLQAVELETYWMLAEQGELWADWGLLLELEKSYIRDQWEMTAGVLFEKEFEQTSLTINTLLVYEFGEAINNELELEFRAQYRYRWIPEIQPAIELYTGQNFVGLGPAFMGIHRFEGQKQLKWELAFIAGLNGDAKDNTLRFALEYEF